MITIEDNFKTKLSFNTYAALGSFDGLHLGHISLINKAVEEAKKHQCRSMVITFKNHPLSVIDNSLYPKLLMDNSSKEAILEKLDVDLLNFIKFDKSFMRISPEDFIINMIEHYNIKGIIVGFNYRFGYKNLGDIELLKKLCLEYKIDLHIIPPVLYEGEIISSTRIRTLLQEGKVEDANRMLIRSYSISGCVGSGRQLGRTIGFPTANVCYDDKYVLPKGGVYFTIVEHDSKRYKGITNVGVNPTVSGSELTVETYILNFDSDIYGENIKVFFVSRMRDEERFASLEALKNQLISDKIHAESQKIENI